MHSDFKAEYAKSEQPQHRVQITKPFYMAAYETTQAQYEQLMGTNPSYFSNGVSRVGSSIRMSDRRIGDRSHHGTQNAGHSRPSAGTDVVDHGRRTRR
ncbi:MAG: SUMF1/EgtB/PvdO family nonheme iron enzyme [Planctomycetaceae bacterium]